MNDIKPMTTERLRDLYAMALRCDGRKDAPTLSGLATGLQDALDEIERLRTVQTALFNALDNMTELFDDECFGGPAAVKMARSALRLANGEDE